jgi:nucleolar MIF4G domain-containing protein 1
LRILTFRIVNQEKAYNPYYTMIGQHLCRGSPSFQITLQYCLWDFLREIGEDEVGGTTTGSNLGAGVGAADKKATSSSKIQNVAHAYGWWTAKGSIGLSVLKVSSHANRQARSYSP